MEIILLERIEHLGKMGDIVNVKTGYARNYLLPQKKALRSTKENLAYFESKRAELEAHNLKMKQDAEVDAKKMHGFAISMVRQAAESGQLYGSVSVRDIYEALKDAGLKVERHQIDLGQPLKNIGVYDVRIVLHPDVSENIKLTIARSQEESAKLAASYNADLVKPVEDVAEEVVAQTAPAEEVAE